MGASLPEERVRPGEHAEEDDARRPEVDGRVLLGALQQHLRRAEPGRARARRLLVRSLLAASAYNKTAWLGNCQIDF